MNAGGGPPVGWGTAGYPRSAIPPLNVPGAHYDGMHGGGMFSHHAGYGPPHHMSPTEDGPGNFGPMHHPGGRDMMMPPSSYPYPPTDQAQWGFNGGPPGNHSGSLSSLLNPSGGAYPRPSVNTYGGSFPGGMQGHSPASPDSRPNTGYSVASTASAFEEKPGHFGHEYSRPNSSHHRQMSPGPGSRPGSSHQPNFQQAGGLRAGGRGRRHSQAPYPLPYDGADGRPSTSPPDGTNEHHLGRARSLMQLQTSNGGGNGDSGYGFNSSHGDFAYSAGGIPNGMDSMDPYSTSIRPSTSTSSLSAASHASSQANTPPVTAGGGPEADINRCKSRSRARASSSRSWALTSVEPLVSPDFGFMHPLSEKPPSFHKTAAGGELVH
jgi:hypothetical protein